MTTDRLDLGDAIGKHYTESEQRRRGAVASELRNFTPDPSMDQLIDLMTSGQQVRSSTRKAAVAYQQVKTHAAVFAATGCLPDGKPYRATNPEGPAAA